ERLRTLVRPAAQVKPQRRLAFAEDVRDALAEADLALLDAPIAAAAFRPAGLRTFHHVRHQLWLRSSASRSSAAGKSAASRSTPARGSAFCFASRCGTVLIV